MSDETKLRKEVKRLEKDLEAKRKELREKEGDKRTVRLNSPLYLTR